MKFVLLVVLTALISSQSFAQAQSGWRAESFTLNSKILKQNKLDLNLQREVWVWLPPGYDSSNKRYPVIHYIHNYGWSAQQMHEVDSIGETFGRALERNQTNEFIFVVGDYRATHTPGTFCGNNKVVGHWWDHVKEELVPAIDKRYRTLAKPASRGVSGDFIGGYCAIRLAMERPGVFSSVYAIHPVGTSISGDRLLRSIPNWQIMNEAKSYDALSEMDGYTRAFLLMAQSHVPNLSKPPFYADFMMDIVNGELVVNPNSVTRLSDNFPLDNRVRHSIDELKSLRGFMFDWGRYDPNIGHINSNQRFTRELAEYDIPHFAEEHGGTEWSDTWIPFGRVEDRMLPFFKRFLEAE